MCWPLILLIPRANQLETASSCPNSSDFLPIQSDSRLLLSPSTSAYLRLPISCLSPQVSPLHPPRVSAVWALGSSHSQFWLMAKEATESTKGFQATWHFRADQRRRGGRVAGRDRTRPVLGTTTIGRHRKSGGRHRSAVETRAMFRVIPRGGFFDIWSLWSLVTSRRMDSPKSSEHRRPSPTTKR